MPVYRKNEHPCKRWLQQACHDTCLLIIKDLTIDRIIAKRERGLLFVVCRVWIIYIEEKQWSKGGGGEGEKEEGR